MRWTAGAIAGLFAAQVLCAQAAPYAAQETERTRQLLHSEQWVSRAWGAYFAGRLHSDDIDRTLIEQLRSASALSNAQPRTEEYAFLAALFEALIEADVRVPAALLDPFEDEWTDPVMILLARDKESEDALLRLRGEKSRTTVWLAANNLLFERKSQAWYAATLGEIDITGNAMEPLPPVAPREIDLE